MVIGTRIAVLGAARNIEPYVESVMQNFRAIRSRFPESEFFIVESDSSDRCLRMLRGHAKTFPGLHIHSLGRLRWRVWGGRMARLAIARNHAYSLVRGKPFDFMVWMDMDDVVESPLDPAILDARLTAPEGWAMLTATKAGRYYDIWALRHPTICSFDCVRELSKFPPGDEAARERFILTPERLVLEALESSRFLEVESAFGGLAIVRNDQDWGPDPFVGLDAEGKQIIEWASWCARLRAQGGRVFIDRDLRIG
jgi:hypothetical protein